ncbi:hypothetical protein [Enterococcus sp. AZ072]|uniref:hypothetical protein n=1 Tax=unclassified Enterococcus TaxID=2608891 RepID=UPI003D2B70AD
MKKEEFLEKIDKAITNGWGIKVYVNMPDLPKPEIICNPPENIKGKRDYYDKAYDDDMKLKTLDQINIIDLQFLNLK